MLFYAAWTWFLHLLLTHQPHHSYRHDIRFWIPITLQVHLQLHLPVPNYRHRHNPISHHQFGIYARLRWKYYLVPSPSLARHLRWAPAKPIRLDDPEFGPEFDHQAHWNQNIHDPESWTAPGFRWYEYKRDHSRHRSRTRAPGLSSESNALLDKWFNILDPLTTFRFQRDLLFEFDLAHKVNCPRMANIAAMGLCEELGITRQEGRRMQQSCYLLDNTHRSDVPIVIDSGSSMSVTPFLEDFITDLEKSDVDDLQGLTHEACVKGMGHVEWKVRDPNGNIALIKCRSHYVPKATIRLHSPQCYFEEHKAGSCLINWLHTVYTTHLGNELVFPHHPASNLPLMTTHDDILQGSLTSHVLFNISHIEDYEGHIKSLLHQENYNLSPQHKELLLWHHRLGHAGFGWIKNLMRKRKGEIGGQSNSPLIPTKDHRTANCNTEHLKCATCQAARQTGRTPSSNRSTSTSILEERQALKKHNEMVLKRDHLLPGDCISVDQCVCKTPGRLPHAFGKEAKTNKCSGGTLMVDHASGFIWIKNQVSLRIGETLRCKHEFEKFASDYGVKLKNFHADNHPFRAKDMLDDMALQDQGITFSGVGAHHQNGVAERNIKTVTTWARALLVHLLIHWPTEFKADLWPFAMEHAVYLWNHLPKESTGLSPFEHFTSQKQHHDDIITRSKVLFCPVYVLDPTLQDGKRLPKWTKRSRLGMCLGNSQQHSTHIGRILNLTTGAVSPQCHVVCDECFSSVHGFLTNEVFDQAEWDELLSFRSIEHIIDHVGRDDIDPAPDLHDDFVSASTPPPANASSVSEGDVADSEDSDSDSEDGTDETPELADPEDNEGVRTRHGRKIKPVPIYAGTFLAQHQPPSRPFPQHVQDCYHAGGNPNQKVKSKTLNEAFISSLEWTTLLSDLRSQNAKSVFVQMLKECDSENETLEEFHPMALGAKANDPDTPNYHEAMNGPNAAGFWEAMRKEIQTLVDMNVWEVVDREPFMDVIPVTWAYKIKRFPSGLVRKLKARLCVRGDLEIENVHFWETFAPVVNWNTVRLLLVLSAQLGLETLQVDYTAAFVHAEVDKPPGHEKMSPEEQCRSSQFAEMPRGFAEQGKALRLKKNLYGKKSAPRLWFQHLKSKLESKECGFKQMTDVDPCLFMSEKVICLVYVDDTL